MIRVNAFPRRRAALMVADLLVIAVSGYAAFLLRFEFTLPPGFSFVGGPTILTWMAVRLLSEVVMGSRQESYRYVSVLDLVRLSMRIAAEGLAAYGIMLWVLPWVSRSVCLIEFLVSLLLLGTVRLSPRLQTELLRLLPSRANRKRTLIYGAGDAGAALIRDLQRQCLSYRVCGFIDDDPKKARSLVYGRPVLGSGAELPQLLEKHRVACLLIAVPRISAATLSKVLEDCERARVQHKILPSLPDLLEGRDYASRLREIRLEDLLGRSPVVLEQDRLLSRLHGQAVLVTGAAGSIGSELCRQIARFQPAAIIGFDTAESGLFEVERELLRTHPGVRFCPEVGSIQSRERLTEVFECYRPSVVYHAAAYKHVPLMESHAFEAVVNNVFGTLNVVQIAEQFGTDDLVMISSDKAVRPTNIMGATKRISELVVRSRGGQRTRFMSVRFGNVLGSNGSVIPQFKSQIAAGGPVTVTHPDMQRYFMTIPEACQLVLQASVMGSGGEIFVLDMGRPVRIVDLAANLIRLAGFRPGEDIQIQFVGTRAGEKLFEELSTADENILPTEHEKILVFTGPVEPWSQLSPKLNELRHACSRRDLAELLDVMTALVPGYSPSEALRRAAGQAIAAVGTN